MKNSKIIFLIILITVTTKLLAVQNPNYTSANDKFIIHYLGIEDGLANNSVTSIYKDKRGLMWIGTYDGICRYDGYNFLTYTNEPNDSSTLINNRIVSIYGTLNEIWIGTKGGVSVYNYLTNTLSTKYYINPKNGKNELINIPINKIKGFNSKIFIASAGKGLFYSFENGEKINRIPLRINGKQEWDYYIQDIDFDKSGKLFAFVQGVGIVTLDSKSNSLKVIYTGIKSGKCVFYDVFSNLWIGLENGLLKYNTINKTFVTYLDEQVRFPITDIIYKPDSKEIWIATDGNGVVKYSMGTNTFSSLKKSIGSGDLNSNAIFSLYLDEVNRVWLATLRGGIGIVEKKHSPFTTISKKNNSTNSLPSNFILSFCEQDKDHIWIGTDGGGASLWNRKDNVFINYSFKSSDYNSLSNNNVTAIIKSQKGVWFATYGGGVCLFDTQTKRFKQYHLLNREGNFENKNIWVLFQSKDGKLWAATPDGEGLYLYNNSSDEFDFIDAKISGIISINQDTSANLWIGTFSQLIKLNLKTMKKQEYDINYPVRSIVSHSRDKMLVGTEGGGLLIFNPLTSEKKVLTKRKGIPNNSILNIVRDNQGYYWVSTYKGIFKFNINNQKITSYYDADGLQSNEFNYNAALKLSTGEILLGGIKGFNIINTGVSNKAYSFPKLVVTSIKVNNKQLEQSGLTAFGIDKLKLPYDESMLSFDYAALEYSLPEKISYAYFLEGWDSQWHYVGNIRSANYSKLTEGDYTLQIKSTNAEGKWNSKIISLPITISPPWYRSFWAYLFYLSTIGFIFYIVDQYKRKQANLKYEVKLSQDLAKQEKELNEKKLTFFTNISHEFRSPLTMIINPLKDIIYGKEQQLDLGAIEMVYSNSRRLLSLVDQLLLFRKTETETGNLKVSRIEVVSLCKEVYSCFVHHAKTKKIDYTFNTNIDEMYIYGDRQKLEIAIFNLISNALKFTEKEDGIVVVNFNCINDKVIISVTDNGEGISKKDRNKIFDLFYQSDKNIKNNRKGFGIGLYLVKQFISQHHGKVSFSDNENGGTVFKITLKQGKEHFGNIKINEELSYATPFIESVLEDKELQKNDFVQKESPDVTDILVKDFKSILIVDDNSQVRSYLESILTTKYNVVTADSAESALDKIENLQPDLIISDVVMGGMNGVEFCKQLKEDVELKHIPFILLTGSTSEEVKLKGAEVGADDYITKPFDKDYLLARINGILNQRESVQKYLLSSVTKNVSTPKLSDEDKKLLDRIIEVMDANISSDSFNIKDLSNELGMSHSFIYKKIKKITGKSVSEFIRNVRLRKAATLLITADLQISQAASMTGFGDIKYFRKQFQQFYGMNPSEFKKKYQNIKENKYILNESFWNSNL